jgi:hypothetical protein
MSTEDRQAAVGLRCHADDLPTPAIEVEEQRTYQLLQQQQLHERAQRVKIRLATHRKACD